MAVARNAVALIPLLAAKAAVYCCGGVWFIDKPHATSKHRPDKAR